MSWPVPLRCPPGASSSSSSRTYWSTFSWSPRPYPWWPGWWSSPIPRLVGAGLLPFDAIVIVAILLLNACLGYAQEAKAERAVDALASNAPHASVLRDGQVVSLETSQIVPGDVVVLAEGDTVSADGRFLTAAGLRVAEASLTGEPLPVSKRPARLDKTPPWTTGPTWPSTGPR